MQAQPADIRPLDKPPLLLIGFNRPDHFQRVIEASRAAGRRSVYVSVDGPRRDRPEEAALCSEVRALAEQIEWADEVKIKAEEQNLGCRRAVTEAIDWVLGDWTEVIILEDDCLPDPSFFRFCDELLRRYRDDERVMEISGSNWGVAESKFGGYSYSFSSYANIWGWATWRRAWARYVPEMTTSWPAVRDSGRAEEMLVGRRARKTFERTWDRLCETDSEWYRQYGGDWSLNWQYSVMLHHGLSVVPAHNLVRNIGFEAGGTHLAESDRTYGAMPLEQASFPLRHPPQVARTLELDALYDRIRWRKHGWPAQTFFRLVRNRRLNRVIRRALHRVIPRPT